MKILYYHQYFSTPTGSTGTRSYEMAKALVARGHDVTIVCSNSALSKTGLTEKFSRGVRRGKCDGINIIELDLRYSNNDSFFIRAIKFLRFAAKGCSIAWKERYDLLFASSTPLTAGIPGIFAKLTRRKTFIFEVRDLWPELPKAMGVVKNPIILAMMSVLEWISYKMADGCVGLSPGIVEGINRRSTNKNKTTLIPNGCDLNLFTPDGEKAPCPNGTLPGDFCAIFTGAHGMANGLDAVLDAASELKKRGRTDIKLIFIGNGKKKKTLIERAAKQNLTNCIFMKPIPKTDLASLLRRCDVGLMVLSNVPAFYYGTSPNKFFDYISAGIPIINNYPGWIAEMITENKCGIAVDPENPKLFANALMELADNPQKVEEFGQNSRALAIEKFSRDRLASNFCQFLETHS